MDAHLVMRSFLYPCYSKSSVRHTILVSRCSRNRLASLQPTPVNVCRRRIPNSYRSFPNMSFPGARTPSEDPFLPSVEVLGLVPDILMALTDEECDTKAIGSGFRDTFESGGLYPLPIPAASTIIFTVVYYLFPRINSMQFLRHTACLGRSLWMKAVKPR